MYLYNVNVEFEDIDSYGIIHHPRVLYFLERARVHFFLDNGIDVNTHDTSVGFVLRNINIQLKKQIVMFNKLDIEVRTKNIDRYRFTFDYQIKCNGKVMITSDIEMVLIDVNTKKLIQIPDDIRTILEKIEINSEC